MSRKIHDFAAANLFVIGTVGMLPYLFIAKNDIGNIPPRCHWEVTRRRTGTTTPSNSTGSSKRGGRGGACSLPTRGVHAKGC